MKAVSHIPAAEVVAHRIVWSVPLAGLVLVWLGRTQDVKVALRSPRVLMMATVTAALITINWGIYVWAIGAGRAIETALGYYINPLFSIFLGALLLKERPNPAQMVAIGLAALAVGVLAFDAGGLPGFRSGCAFPGVSTRSSGRRCRSGRTRASSSKSCCSASRLRAMSSGSRRRAGPLPRRPNMTDVLLLLACGIVTAVPLMIYANGAKLLRLSTIGIMQYIAPTMIFLIAVFVFHEPFGTAKLVAFALIWAALFIYSGAMLAESRARRAAQPTPAE